MSSPPYRPHLATGAAGLRQLVAELEDEILERRRAEDELRKSEERFRLLAEHARDIVYRYRVGGGGAFEYISPIVAEITGYAPGEFYRDPGLAVRRVHPDDRQLVGDYVEVGDYARPLSCRLLHRDGRTLWLQPRHLPIYSRHGDLVAIEGIARDVTEEKRLVEGLARYSSSLEEKDRLLREFSARTIRLQEEERRRVARELHDGVNQLLCAVGFGVEIACRDTSGTAVAGGLERVRELVDRSIRELRRISDDLRPVVLDDLGLGPAVRSLGEQVAERTGLRIDVHLDPVPASLPPEIAIAAYRLLQEALLGLERRGEADRVEVAVSAADERLCITVRGALAAADSVGAGAPALDNMRERARLAGGSLTVEEQSDATCLLFRFPLQWEDVS